MQSKTSGLLRQVVHACYLTCFVVGSCCLKSDMSVGRIHVSGKKRYSWKLPEDEKRMPCLGQPLETAFASAGGYGLSTKFTRPRAARVEVSGGRVPSCSCV